MLRSLALTATLAMLAAGTALPQETPRTPALKSALAAGYKALFTCSATFTAERTRAEIENNELSGIYRDYEDAIQRVSEPNVNLRSRTVAVRYPGELPPRIAAWRPGYGCTLLPIGASIEDTDWLTRFAGWPDAPEADGSTALGDKVDLVEPALFEQALLAPVSAAFDAATYGEGTRTSAVVIVRNGQVMSERYERGLTPETPQRTWSVAKSLTATIIGVADQEGLVDLDYPAVVSQWTQGGDPRREITLRHLLHMASGLDSSLRGNRTDEIYFGGARVIDKALTSPLEAAPGTRFKYANNDTLAAMRGLREAIGDDAVFASYPYEKLLWKIGARNTTLETDWNGDFISSSQVWMSARDMARLGQLYLQDGVWGGERLLPEGWAGFAATPAPAQPDREDPGSFGYGAAFWLLDAHDGVPDDTFAGIGNRGQYLVIVPSEKTVIVRRGYDIDGGARFDIAAFTADILAALEAAETGRVAMQEAASAAEAEEASGTP